VYLPLCGAKLARSCHSFFVLSWNFLQWSALLRVRVRVRVRARARATVRVSLG